MTALRHFSGCLLLADLLPFGLLSSKIPHGIKQPLAEVSSSHTARQPEFPSSMHDIMLNEDGCGAQAKEGSRFIVSP